VPKKPFRSQDQHFTGFSFFKRRDSLPALVKSVRTSGPDVFRERQMLKHQMLLFCCVIGSTSLFAATPNLLTTNDSGPIGVAATPSRLLFTEPFCTPGPVDRGVYSVNPTTGAITELAHIPGDGCVENYIAISPGNPGFPNGNAYVTSNSTIYEVTPTGTVSVLAVTGSPLTAIDGHSGIGFNSVTGQLLFSSSGGVWTINSFHVATKLANGFCTACHIESPTADASGTIFVTVEDDSSAGGLGPFSGIYKIAGRALISVAAAGGKAAPEAIQFVPPVQCGLTIQGKTYGGFLSVFSTNTVGLLRPTSSQIDGYLLGDIGAQAGKFIVSLEYGSGPLPVADGTTRVLDTFPDAKPSDVLVMSLASATPTFADFGDVHNQLEGFNIVVCGPARGCPATKGFWHKPENWTNASVTVGGITYDGATHSMTIGGVTYSQADLLLFLPTGQPPKGGNGYIIGGSQLIAAVLNIAAGAQYSPSVIAAISTMNSLLTGIHMISGGTIIGTPSDPLNSQLISLGGTLDNYNSAVGLNCSEGAGLSTGSGK
jgi:hypothetical protein